MKIYLFMCIAAIIFLNVWGANEVSAQTLKAVRAEVGFDFRVGDRVYPAGVYRIESVSSGSDYILRLRGGEKSKQQLIFANSEYADEKQAPKLVFRQIGDEYYLTNIFMANDAWGYTLPRSRRLRESERNLASTQKIEVPAKN